MRWHKCFLLLLALWCSVASAVAAPAKVIKVLPHYLDREGRHALSPSLYDRDAYQAVLRRNPEQRSAIRFDIQWRARAASSDNLKLRLELRGTKTTLPLV